jgi:hypothetical protein
MSGKRGGWRPGAGRPKLTDSSSQMPQLFSGPSLSVPGVPGRSDVISPFFGTPTGAHRSRTSSLPSDLSRSSASAASAVTTVHGMQAGENLSS